MIYFSWATQIILAIISFLWLIPYYIAFKVGNRKYMSKTLDLSCNNRYTLMYYSGFFISILWYIMPFLNQPRFKLNIFSLFDIKVILLENVLYNIILIALIGYFMSVWGTKVVNCNLQATKDRFLHPSKLITEGPYKKVRNPMIMGDLFCHLSFILLLGAIHTLCLYIIYICINLVIVYIENKYSLCIHFKKEYEEYAKKTPAYMNQELWLFAIFYLVSNGLTKQIIMILIKIKHLLFASGNMLLLWVFYNFTFFMLVACSHREQVYSLETEIMISADWSRSGLNEKEQDYGATTVFYPTDGSSPIMVLMGDRTYKTVYLKEGRYDVVLFNRSFDDFGNLGFRGEDAYRTLEAHATNVVTKDVPSTEIIIMDSPDELAADCMESFEVTPGMSGNYSSGMTNWGGKKIDGSKNGCQLCFLPQKLTQKITVKIRIKGMNNIRNATCKLDGIAESVFLASGQISEKTVAQEFCLGNPVYNSGSATDGTLSASISVFGFDTEISHNLHLRAELVDGKTTFEESFDDLKISQLEEGDGRMSIFIDMTCEKKVPNVKVEGSSGFDANVDDWEDEVNSDIDI